MSSDLSAVGPIREKLKMVIEENGYSLDQIFNADETGLWWRMIHSTSLNSSRITRASSFKKAKDRVTVLEFSNASGSHRLPLVFINKSAKPRCFKHIDISSLHVQYYSQRKSWMDRKMFGEWFHEKFVPSVRRFCGERGLRKRGFYFLTTHPHILHVRASYSQMMVWLKLCSYHLTLRLPYSQWIKQF